MTIEEAIVQRLRGLPLERQREVLDFVEFLESKASLARDKVQVRRVSALEFAGKLVGSVEGGPGDLATNREHMKDYGT